MDKKLVEDIISQLNNVYNGIIISIGIVIAIIGLIFLLLNYKVIKSLYFFSGFILVFLTSLAIGLVILNTRATSLILNNIGNEELSDYLLKNVLILFSCSLGISIISGTLAIYFNKLGMILMGLSCGMMLGIAIGNSTGNTIAFITITVSLSFISGILSFFFKHIFEMIASSVAGGFLFANGYRLIFIGAAVILLDVDSLMNYYYTIYISTTIIQLSITLIFGIYHLIVYKREKKQFPPYSGPVAV